MYSHVNVTTMLRFKNVALQCLRLQVASEAKGLLFYSRSAGRGWAGHGSNLP
jgi:hypothetical protein